MKYCFDLDGTICDTPLRPDDNKPGYLESTPFPFMVEQVNRLFDEGHKIIIMTARGRGSGIDWTDLTIEQFCLLYTSPSPRDRQKSRMPSSA